MPGADAKSIFGKALEIADPAEQAAFVAQACAENQSLRKEVESLLAANAAAGDFLGPCDSGNGATQAYAPGQEQAGQQGWGKVIGPYKLLQLLGEGGMGLVYLAEQSEPVKRRVALKIIKAGQDSRQIATRFEAERQALALMDHPHIAKVFDAGTAPDGSPYFVMELVKGLPITRYCDQEHLSPRERLELFIPVCQAVQHAHQKGIIHRDLKPSNVLIGLYDGKPVPKVIDFGVAKAVHHKLTEDTLFTQVGMIIGTLEYMAPEQAELNNLDIDTRADIYSLGVILYELLTGSPPFSSKQLRSAAFSEMLRMIREVEPSKPSTKLSSSEELPSIAANRRLEPKRLTAQVCGEMDWIVMKCLEKERGRRYETANQLGLELQRYLADEPVLAGPPSAVYRMKKFVQRNKGPVWAAGIITGLLLAGVIGTVSGLIRARDAEGLALNRLTRAENAENQLLQQLEIITKQENQVREERDSARQAEADLRAFATFLVDDVLAVARPTGAQGGMGITVTVARALQMAEAKVAERFKGAPLAEATARQALGVTFRNLGNTATAEKHLRLALALRRRLLGDSHEDTLTSMNSLGAVLLNLARENEAVPILEEVCRLSETHRDPDCHATLTCRDNLATAYRMLGHLQKAHDLYSKNLRAMKRMLGDDHEDTLGCTSNLASLLQALGKRTESLQMLEPAVTRMRKVLVTGHPTTLIGMSNLAGLLAELDFERAPPLFEEAILLHQEHLGKTHHATFRVMGRYAASLWKQGRYQLSVSRYEDLVKKMTDANGVNDPETLHAMSNLVQNYSDAKRPEDAIPLGESMVKSSRALLGPLHATTRFGIRTLSSAYLKVGERAKAEELYRQLVDAWKNDTTIPASEKASFCRERGINLAWLKQLPQAEAALRECVTWSQSAGEDVNHLEAGLLLAQVLANQLKTDEAAKETMSAFERFLKTGAAFPVSLVTVIDPALEWLVKYHTQRGWLDEAEKWQSMLGQFKKQRSDAQSK